MRQSAWQRGWGAGWGDLARVIQLGNHKSAVEPRIWHQTAPVLWARASPLCSEKCSPWSLGEVHRKTRCHGVTHEPPLPSTYVWGTVLGARGQGEPAGPDLSSGAAVWHGERAGRTHSRGQEPVSRGA